MISLLSSVGGGSARIPSYCIAFTPSSQFWHMHFCEKVNKDAICAALSKYRYGGLTTILRMMRRGRVCFELIWPPDLISMHWTPIEAVGKPSLSCTSTSTGMIHHCRRTIRCNSKSTRVFRRFFNCLVTCIISAVADSAIQRWRSKKSTRESAPEPSLNFRLSGSSTDPVASHYHRDNYDDFEITEVDASPGETNHEGRHSGHYESMERQRSHGKEEDSIVEVMRYPDHDRPSQRGWRERSARPSRQDSTGTRGGPIIVQSRNRPRERLKSP